MVIVSIVSIASVWWPVSIPISSVSVISILYSVFFTFPFVSGFINFLFFVHYVVSGGFSFSCSGDLKGFLAFAPALD